MSAQSLARGARGRKGVRRTGYLFAVAGTLVVGGLVNGGLASATAPQTCTGTMAKPGVLAGDITGNVTVTGLCAVNGGPTTVHGSVTIAAGGGLDATFAKNDIGGSGASSLIVTGSVVVGKGATAGLGCFATSSPCADDPNMKKPTLNSPVTIGGNLIANGALGVIVHDGHIGGNVVQTGGGGGLTCVPEGIFKTLIKSPVFSDYEDNHVAGNVTITKLHSCYLGVLRDHIGGSLTLGGNKMADPDAIEVGDNVIAKNLACTNNTMVWDTSDITNKLYPRALKRNKVHGTRSGQCVRSTATTKGGAAGRYPF